VVCVCALVPELAPRTKVVILQHPRERKVAIGTAKMAARCLKGARVVVGVELDQDPRVKPLLADPERPPVLLWPGPGAKDLTREPPRGPVTLVAVDGTWHLAKRLLEKNPGIAALPRYGISPSAPSAYRIRREPRAECLSTIEALSQALGVLEGEPEAYARMMLPFRAMVEAQIEQHRRSRAPRDKSRLKSRRRRPWVIPAPLADPSRVTLVAVEANSYPLDAPYRAPDELVACCVVRGDGAEPVELVLKPSHAPAPHVTTHTGLSVERLLAGAERSALRELLSARLAAAPVLGVWGSFAARMLRQEGLLDGVAVVDLRSTASRWLRSAPGSIERCAEQMGGVPPVLGSGRGGRRLGLLLHVLRALARPRPD
jgi:DTW domain-containing protein YfiP